MVVTESYYTVTYNSVRYGFHRCGTRFDSVEDARRFIDNIKAADISVDECAVEKTVITKTVDVVREEIFF